MSERAPVNEVRTAVLLLSCPDQRGLVASVSDFIYRHKGNIVHADQHTDREQGVFLQRVEWDKDGFVARLYPFTRSRRSPAEETSQPRVVTMDPRVEFGRPILKVSAIPTAVIADRYKAGESIADLADDYGEDPLNIEEAVRCELQPAKAA